ncbi:MAG: hypothetical protein ACI4GB_04950 [Acutalibacteraceae bacterium]
MGEKKFNFKAAVHGAGKNASDLFGKAKDAIVRAADQNDDGKFDKEDVTAIADTVGETVKSGAQAIKESAEEKSRQIELKRLQPIFAETMDSAGFFMPKFIRIAERDKRHADSEVCKVQLAIFQIKRGYEL